MFLQANGCCELTLGRPSDRDMLDSPSVVFEWLAKGRQEVVLLAQVPGSGVTVDPSGVRGWLSGFEREELAGFGSPIGVGVGLACSWRPVDVSQVDDIPSHGQHRE